MFYDACQKGPYKVSGYHDPDSVRFMRIVFRPAVWQAATVYRIPNADNPDAVMPTTDTGVYYVVETPGKSGAADPFSGDAPDDIVTDGTLGLTWKTKAYNLMPMSITVSSATFTATNGVTVSSTAYDTTTCQFFIDAIGSTAAARTTGKFHVTVHVVFDNTEESDITLEFKLAEH